MTLSQPQILTGRLLIDLRRTSEIPFQNGGEHGQTSRFFSVRFAISSIRLGDIVETLNYNDQQEDAEGDCEIVADA